MLSRLFISAYFAFSKRPLLNSKGQNVSAITGFLNTIHDLKNNRGATHMVVAFDPPGPTFRSEEFPFYKAHREETPEDIRWSVPQIKNILNALKIPILEVAGYEADDVIGTIAKKAAADDYTVYMVTPDKDYCQLVAENIFMYKPAYLNKPVEVLGVSEVLEKWDIELD